MEGCENEGFSSADEIISCERMNLDEETPNPQNKALMTIPEDDHKYWECIENRKKSESQRTLLLTSIRGVLLSHGENGIVTVRQVEDIFTETNLPRMLFSLFDDNCQGFLDHESWIAGMRASGDDFKKEQKEPVRDFVEFVEAIAYLICGEDCLLYTSPSPRDS